jgi:hypothetical protein
VWMSILSHFEYVMSMQRNRHMQSYREMGTVLQSRNANTDIIVPVYMISVYKPLLH